MPVLNTILPEKEAKHVLETVNHMNVDYFFVFLFFQSIFSVLSASNSFVDVSLVTQEIGAHASRV